MSKNTSILIGDYFLEFIRNQVSTGRFTSASEVVRTALRMFEQEENKKKALITELKKGEKSGFIDKITQEDFLSSMHKKHLNE